MGDLSEVDASGFRLLKAHWGLLDLVDRWGWVVCGGETMRRLGLVGVRCWGLGLLVRPGWRMADVGQGLSALFWKSHWISDKASRTSRSV